jgi:hypothetical protein
MFANVYAYAATIRKGNNPDPRNVTHCAYCCEPTDPYKVRHFSLINLSTILNQFFRFFNAPPATASGTVAVPANDSIGRLCLPMEDTLEILIKTNAHKSR